MTRQLISWKNAWQLLVLTGALQWAAAGCSSDASNIGGAGGSDGGTDATGGGGKLGGTGGRGTGGNVPVDAGNPACASGLYSRVSAFGAIFDGWDVAPNSSPELAPMTGADGGFTGGTFRELDQTDGDPTNGSVKLTIPFTAPNQTLLFARLYTGFNMQGATISARVKLDSGLITGPTDSGRAFIALKTTASYTYAEGPDISLDPTAGWRTIRASADAPGANVGAGYTSCDVREIDVVIQTGPTGNYRQAVVHIDTIEISYPSGVDASVHDEAGAGTDASDSGPGDTPASTPDATDAPASTPDASDDASSGG